MSPGAARSVLRVVPPGSDPSSRDLSTLIPRLPWVAALVGMGVDLALTLAALSIDWSDGAANIAGFLVGNVAFLALRRLTSRSTPVPAGAPRQGLGWYSLPGLGIVALGMRGGAVATGLAGGLPGWLAVAGGLVVAWGLLAVSQIAHDLVSARPQPSAASRWRLASVGILATLFLLHLLYLGVLPVTPEEAYYWNYSIHPAPGYLDHPPMVAWLIGIAQFVFGQGVASLRIPSLACGVVVIVFAYRFARRLVDPPAALLAAALTAVIPYLFFATGLMMTPDAPLAAAWAASLYFLHRALVGGEGRAWYSAGIALGLGLLSKYTIVTLGFGAVAFCLLDRRARGWLLRPQPYVAFLIAILLFAPVVYWNWANDWASFRFQSGGRFGEETQFSLHLMLGNMLIVATPLPLLVLPLLFSGQWMAPPSDAPHASARNRLFVGCVVLVPLAIFAWSALSHPPRLNWTGPIWLATLPLLGWALARAEALRWRGLGAALRLSAGPILGGLLVLYAALSYYLVLGLPGVPYPRASARALGWPEATHELRLVHDRIASETGSAPVIVGMDKYNIASQVSYFGASAEAGRVPLRATTLWALSGSRLMFSYWDPPEQFRGNTLILVAPKKDLLATERLAPHFGQLEPEIQPLPLRASGPGGDGRLVTVYYYRIGYDYRPSAPGL